MNQLEEKAVELAKFLDNILLEDLDPHEYLHLEDLNKVSKLFQLNKELKSSLSSFRVNKSQSKEKTCSHYRATRNPRFEEIVDAYKKGKKIKYKKNGYDEWFVYGVSALGSYPPLGAALSEWRVENVIKYRVALCSSDNSYWTTVVNTDEDADRLEQSTLTFVRWLTEWTEEEMM